MGNPSAYEYDFPDNHIYPDYPARYAGQQARNDSILHECVL
jgi:hypothetical protein